MGFRRFPNYGLRSKEEMKISCTQGAGQGEGLESLTGIRMLGVQRLCDIGVKVIMSLQCVKLLLVLDTVDPIL